MCGARLFVGIRLERISRHWKVCGIALPAGLKESDKLPQPNFYTGDKAASGHDENIAFEQAADMIGNRLRRRCADVTLEI